MSRTTDLRLSGWVIDNNLFDKDLRFINLIEDKGALSFLIYTIMRGMIGSNNGYYIELNDRLILKIHRTLGRCSKGQSFIKETILYFSENGILDKHSYQNNILTSIDIQENWLNAKKRAKLQNVELEHWLLVDTLPTPTDNNCNNNSNTCNNNSNSCYNKHDTCNHKLTKELVKNNNTNNIESEKETFNSQKVLNIIYSKNETAKNTFANSDIYENIYTYADYLANACNDTRILTYEHGTEKLKIDNNFFINYLYEANSFDIYKVFRDCYDKTSSIDCDAEYYLRGIIVHKNIKLAHKMQKKYVRATL